MKMLERVAWTLVSFGYLFLLDWMSNPDTVLRGLINGLAAVTLMLCTVFLYEFITTFVQQWREDPPRGWFK